MRKVAVLVVAGLLTACSGSPSLAHGKGRPAVTRPVPVPTAAWIVGQCVSASFDGRSEHDAKSAGAKVIANVTLNCPAGTTEPVTDIDRYPSRTCLRRL